MIDNLMLNNFLSRHNLYEWIFNLYKKTGFTYLFVIFGLVDDGNPDASSKNPIKKYFCWSPTDTDDLYDKVNEFRTEAKNSNKEFFALRVEEDEESKYRITIVTKQLISTAGERDRLKLAKDGSTIAHVTVPDKFQMPLDCRAKYE